MTRALSPKAERTRAKILAAALELFREHGYDETTMRAVASQAGVSTGNAYYYFESKEHLVQGFYSQAHVEHLAACEPYLAGSKDFKARYLGVLRAKLESAAPYHRFSGQLFKTAADPESPLNPFSVESEPTRDEAIELMRRVIEGSSLRVPKDLSPELPRLLWMHLMGVVLFWIHDRSPEQEKSYHMAERTGEIVVRLTTLAANPLLRPLRRSVLSLLAELGMKSD